MLILAWVTGYKKELAEMARKTLLESSRFRFIRPRFFGAARYASQQALRTAYYAAQYTAAQALTPPLSINPEPRLPKQSFPGWGGILKDLAALYRQDWRHIQAGIYRAPEGEELHPSRMLDGARRFFSHLPGVVQRRRLNGHSDINQPDLQRHYPRYYLQNFHFQNDGWLSAESADVYDQQVEVLFTGGADAMRRQALPAIRDTIRASSSQQSLSMIDIACGSGRFLRDVLRSFPELQVTGLDLSKPYLEKAARTLDGYPNVTFVEAAAENTGLQSAQFDVASAVFLFHELPPKIRAQVAEETFRILRPGGTFIMVDTIVKGDHPPYDSLLDRFPAAFHEPYYAGYVRSNPATLFENAGFDTVTVERAFFSRVMVMKKPE